MRIPEQQNVPPMPPVKPPKESRMSNKEARAVLKSELDGIPSDIDKSEFEQALNLAFKAIRIVEVIENCFIHNRGEGLIGLDDWEDIKKFVEKEAENDTN